MKKLGNSVFPAASPLWADAGNASSSLSFSDDCSQPLGEPVTVAIVKDTPHARALLECMVGRARSLRYVACQHRMDLPPCSGIKRADSTDLTNKAVAGAGAAISSVADWIGEINTIWAKGTSNTLELARIVFRARRTMRCGAWAQMWRSKQLPFAISKAKMLIRIGKHLGDLDGQTFGHLPSGWSILYELSKLPRALFEEFVGNKWIHPGLKLREAKALVARLRGKPTEARTRKANVRRWLRRSAEFLRNSVSDWDPDERELATEELTRFIEQIAAAGGMALMRNGDSLNFITQCNLLTDQRNNL